MSGVDTEAEDVAPRRWGVATVALTVIVLAIATALLGLTPVVPTESRTVTSMGHVRHIYKVTGPVTFAAVGDSITAQSYQGSHFAWQSWAISANQPGHTEFLQGGYAVPGRTTVDMLAGTGPLTADVFVFEGAVNDVNLHYAHSDILERIRQIVAVTTIQKVVVAALPPNDRYPADALTFNAELAAYSAAQGWTFIDPWVDYRNADGTYVAGAAWDDLHPAEVTAVAVGLTMSDAIWACAGGQKIL